MTSAYKVESNRRNARRSTGPRTAAGKERVRLNALSHGLTAQTAVLPDEDPTAFVQQQDALMGVFNPRDDVELKLAETFVLATWKRDRCTRAETGLIAQRMQRAELEDAVKEYHEVIALGQRLFWDRRGDPRDYPHDAVECEHDKRTSYLPKAEDPDDPAHILLDLESTITGCRWLLARWAELKDRLSPGLSWHSQDKLTATRLLGKQPLDALDDPVVCLIFVASHVADPLCDHPFFELEQEFVNPSLERCRFLRRLKERPWKALRPRDPAEARQKLAEIVDTATARLETIIASHEKRAERYAEKAAYRLAFDPSDEAERLRRHERACVRDMFRSLSQLIRLRESDGPFPADEAAGRHHPSAPARVVSDRHQSDVPAAFHSPRIDWPASADECLAEPLTAENAQPAPEDEPPTTDDGPILQNEANAACSDEAGSTEQTAETARPEAENSADTAQTGAGASAGEAVSPGVPDSVARRSPFTFAVPPAADAWITCSRAPRMLRAAAALSRRREADLAQRKRAREQNRRDRAEQLAKRRRREEATRRRDAAPLAGVAPPISQQKPSAVYGDRGAFPT
jgi:hypothetical protein